ncbi:MAG: hypothetical protein QW404_03455 [Candidatus Nanoarchaeia archaeon]
MIFNFLKPSKEKLEKQIEDLEIRLDGIKLLLTDPNVFYNRGEYSNWLIGAKQEYKQISESLRKKRELYYEMTGSYAPSLNLRGGRWKIRT